MGKCGGVLKFHSPVNGLSIKWCTCVSDWDAPREKLEALKKLNILKKVGNIENVGNIEKVGDVEGGRGKTETGSGRLAT